MDDSSRVESRIDVLPRKRTALQKLTGAVLSLEPDAALQRVVDGIALQLGVPMAHVSIILQRIQFFRAQRGLPKELAAARATDRNISFSQFVVRDNAVFALVDAKDDPSVPQELVHRYGMRSFLGAPIYLGGEPVGALAVGDNVPRAFDAEARAMLVEAADQVSERLAALSEGPDGSLLDRALRPQFAELRNRMQPMVSGVKEMQVAIAELRAVHRISEYVAQHPEEPASVVPLEAAAEAMRDLEECLEEVSSSVVAVQRAVEALENASLETGETCVLGEVVASASTLAHHYTKLIGGVRWPDHVPSASVGAPLSFAVNALAAALAALSSEVRRVPGSKQGLSVQILREANGVGFRLVAPDLGPARLAINAAAISRLVDDASLLHVRHDAEALDLFFAPARESQSDSIPVVVE